MKSHWRGNKDAVEYFYLLTAGDGKGPAELPDMRRESSISRVLCEFRAESHAEKCGKPPRCVMTGSDTGAEPPKHGGDLHSAPKGICHSSRGAEDPEGLQNKLQICATLSALYRCHLLPVCPLVGLFCSPVRGKCHFGTYFTGIWGRIISHLGNFPPDVQESVSQQLLFTLILVELKKHRDLHSCWKRSCYDCSRK